MFRTGQKVRLKTYEEIKKIYPGRVPYGLVAGMDIYLGEIMTISHAKKDKRKEYEGYCLHFEEDDSCYSWHSSCVDLIACDVTDSVHKEIKRLLS